MIGCLKSRGVKYTPSRDRKVHFRVLLWEIYLLDVFESTKDLVTMKRAALFKKKNYGKLISDVSIMNESNHKRVLDILCSIFQDVLKRPTTEVSATWNNFLQSAKLAQLMKINLFMTFALR